MQPASGSDTWAAPTTQKSNLANVIMRPDQDVQVKLTARVGHQEGNWKVKVSGKEIYGRCHGRRYEGESCYFLARPTNAVRVQT